MFQYAATNKDSEDQFYVNLSYLLYVYLLVVEFTQKALHISTRMVMITETYIMVYDMLM